MEAQFLDHYNRELGFLREMGGEFAAAYPAVAGRLGMSEFDCSDPMVERLLEGFAFMAARVHRRLDAEFDVFTGGLLECIYPHYTRPTPSMAMVSLQVDPAQGAIVDGYDMPRGTSLIRPLSKECPTPVRFETTSPVTLWPIDVQEARWTPRSSGDRTLPPRIASGGKCQSAICITIETNAGLPIQRLSLDKLRLHFCGDDVASTLLQWTLCNATMVAVGCHDQSGAMTGGDAANDQWIYFDSDAIRGVGFADDEAMLPPEPRQFSGYRLLQEYFHLPEKFNGIEISGLAPAVATQEGRQLQIVIGLADHADDIQPRVSAENIVLHATPAINLFQKRADRIVISDTSAEHHLLVDRTRPMDYEIWSIDRLCGHNGTVDEDLEILPMYASPTVAKASSIGRHGDPCYSIHRRPRTPSQNQRQYGQRSTYLGSEVFVTLSMGDVADQRSAVRQLSSTVHCSNRDLPLLKPIGGWRDAFVLDGEGPIASIRCLTQPTDPQAALADQNGDRCWQLVNHLSANVLSLAHQDSVSGTEMVRQIMRQYCPPDMPTAKRQIEGLASIHCRPVVRRLPIAGPIVHGQGLEIEMTLRESGFGGHGTFAFAAVIEQFLSRFAAINSFTQTSYRTDSGGPIHRWPVRTGIREAA